MFLRNFIYNIKKLTFNATALQIKNKLNEKNVTLTKLLKNCKEDLIYRKKKFNLSIIFLFFQTNKNIINLLIYYKIK